MSNYVRDMLEQEDVMSELSGRGVIQLHHREEPRFAEIKQRLEEVIAVFRAIDGAEMLSALPECEVARGQHQTALTLMRMMERELTDLFTMMA